MKWRKVVSAMVVSVVLCLSLVPAARADSYTQEVWWWLSGYEANQGPGIHFGTSVFGVYRSRNDWTVEHEAGSFLQQNLEQTGVVNFFRQDNLTWLGEYNFHVREVLVDIGDDATNTIGGIWHVPKWDKLFGNCCPPDPDRPVLELFWNQWDVTTPEGELFYRAEFLMVGNQPLWREWPTPEGTRLLGTGRPRFLPQIQRWQNSLGQALKIKAKGYPSPPPQSLMELLRPNSPHPEGGGEIGIEVEMDMEVSK